MTTPKEKETIKPLTVFKASAGSGKTFTLAVEYIKLLINNPYDYEHILAVTFTNKATEEMKHRILSQLYGISHNLSDSNDYAEKVCEDLKISPEKCRELAGKALRLLLHNYSFFRVQTIDTFFQGVMRNLAKELNLSNNLRISLNDKQVIGQAVDNMMENLTDNKQLMSWIEEFVSDKMDDEKSWNVSEEIKDFGGNITKEFYKSNRHLLENIFNSPKEFDEIKKRLTEKKRIIADKYKKIGQSFFTTISENHLVPADFANGEKGITSYFRKLINGGFADDKLVNATVTKHLDRAEAWCTAKSPKRSEIIPLVESTLLPLLTKIETERPKDVYEYRSTTLTLHNMNKLRLLCYIENEVRQENGEHSRFLLSDTQTLLYEMIKDDKNIAPFIYEKIGTRIGHIMIDEFQDTSNVQWNNFKALLNNCMSEPQFLEYDPRKITNNLIVGDVKQSIYRFRSGDWTLLNNIDKEYNNEQLSIRSLKTNYRSERNVINFNNAFFIEAAKIEANRIMPEDEDARRAKISAEHMTADLAEKKTLWGADIRKAYSDVSQKVPEKRQDKGLIRVFFTPKNEKEKEELIMDKMLENINELLTLQVPQSEIAILVRKKLDIAVIADHFARHAPSIRLISQEAYQLDSSSAVNCIVTCMRMIERPADRRLRAMAAKAYSKCIGTEEEKLNNFLSGESVDIDDLLPFELSDSMQITRLSTMPLYEMAEALVRILKLNKVEGQSPYISTFFDKLNAYCEENIADTSSFLTFWDEELCRKTIEVGDVDGIRIMTIHKSKGLEFDHVIIPFCDWGLNPPFAENLWCKSNKEIPFVPVNYQNENSLKNSIYETDGSYEAMQNIVDNLNLLYVAFTRAGKSLSVITSLSYSKDGMKEDHRAALLYNSLEAISEELGAEFCAAEDDDQPTTFIYGTFTKREHKDEKSDNVFERNTSNVPVAINSNANESVIFRQSNKSRDFADDITDEDDSRRFIRMGSILHQLFSSIRTEADIPRVLADMEFEGMLYDKEITADKLRENLRKKLENKQVKEWFADRWKVFNECTILYYDEDGKITERRPDRVITDGKETIVIDYKFGKPNDDYANQVRNYMQRLTDMGHTNVKGYLWYVNRNAVEPV